MAKSKRWIKNTEQLIDAMGGTCALANWAGIAPASVSQWRLSGIPPGWHFRLSVDLERLGYLVDAMALGWLSKTNIQSVDG